MVLQFTKDPQTGVIVPPVTVFNGGKRRGSFAKRRNQKIRKSRKANRKTRRLQRR